MMPTIIAWDKYLKLIVFSEPFTRNGLLYCFYAIKKFGFPLGKRPRLALGRLSMALRNYKAYDMAEIICPPRLLPLTAAGVVLKWKLKSISLTGTIDPSTSKEISWKFMNLKTHLPFAHN